MPTGARVGKTCKLYRNGGTPAAPTWVEISQVEDVNLADLTMGIALLKRRASGFTKGLPTIIQPIVIEFNHKDGLGQTMLDLLRADFFAGTVKEYAIMNGDITLTANEGLRCPMMVENFPRNEPLEEVVSKDIRLHIGYMESPAGTEIDPSWYVIS